MAKQRLSQLRTTKDRVQSNFYLPSDVAEWVKVWSEKERKSQTRIVSEILEAEKRRRDRYESKNPLHLFRREPMTFWSPLKESIWIPVFDLEVVSKNCGRFKCPACKKFHHHGTLEGHRLSHCAIEPQPFPHGYYLRLADKYPTENQEAFDERLEKLSQWFQEKLKQDKKSNLRRNEDPNDIS